MHRKGNALCHGKACVWWCGVKQNIIQDVAELGQRANSNLLRLNIQVTYSQTIHHDRTPTYKLCSSQPRKPNHKLQLSIQNIQGLVDNIQLP